MNTESTVVNETQTETVNQDETPTIPAPAPKKRGFALMDRSQIVAIASLGGKAAHKNGTAHQFTKEEARAAGKKGGLAQHKSRGRSKIQNTQS